MFTEENVNGICGVFCGPVFSCAYKMAQIWRSNADDMRKEICYTDIVYKWVQRNPLVFYYNQRSVTENEILSLLRRRTARRRCFFLC